MLAKLGRVQTIFLDIRGYFEVHKKNFWRLCYYSFVFNGNAEYLIVSYTLFPVEL